MVGDAIDSGRRYVNDALDAGALGLFQHNALAVDLRREDLFPAAQREGSGRMDHEVNAFQCGAHRLPVADVAGDRLHLAHHVRIAEGRDVQRYDMLASGTRNRTS